MSCDVWNAAGEAAPYFKVDMPADGESCNGCASSLSCPIMDPEGLHTKQAIVDYLKNFVQGKKQVEKFFQKLMAWQTLQ